MAELVLPEAPQEAEAVIRVVLTGLATRSAFRTPKLSRTDPGKFSLVRPHRVAVLPLALLNGEKGATITDVGWRFLIEADGEELASAAALNRPDGHFQFGGLNEGPLVAGFVKALNGTAVDEPHGEPRLLLVPALHSAALWLVKAGAPVHRLGERDTIVPIEPAHPTLPALRSLRVTEYLSILRALAAGIPVGGARGG